ncbi:MAG: SDR family oxidoreductase [Porticoccaceae bacterium]|nr:SDR family oxidoreductase [Porticoccaceae bacterium]
MLMTVIGRDTSASVYGELAGVRVLITGLSATCGVDVARAFADHRGRLVVQLPEATPENDVVAGLLSETASEIQVYTDPCANNDAACRFAQKASQAFGGLEVVLNLVPITSAELQNRASIAEVEDLVAQKLTIPVNVTRVVANRMRTMMTEGLVLNVMTVPAPRTAGEAALAGVARTALAAVTRGEAEKWAPYGIRVNAIGPRTTAPEAGAYLASEPDIAALALYLASKRGRTLSGHVFDAAGVAARRC